jgi:uncharacterized delta-60 repeat protein
MRRFPVLLLAIVLALVALPAHAARALLDRTFGGDGIVTAFSDGAVATAVGIDAHHRLVAVGYTTHRGVDVAVARFEPNGSPDASFGAHGQRRYDLGGADYAFDAAVIPSGGIVIVGRTSKAQDKMFVLRLRPDGTRQPRFGNHGVKLINFGKPLQSANAVALTHRGRIVVGGYTSNGVGARSALARLSPLGTLDTGFGGDGMVSFDIGSGAEQINDLRVLKSGSIVAAGDAELGQNPRFSILEVRSDGKLDTTFGTGHDGSSTIDVAPGPDVANAFTVAANGDYLLAGYAGTRADPAVLALTKHGIPDPSYGRQGRVVVRLATAFEEAADIVREGAKSLLVGRIRGAGDDIGVIRLKAGGALDTSFSGDGILRIDVAGSTDAGADGLLQPNGKLVVAGQSWRAGVPRFVLARILTS